MEMVNSIFLELGTSLSTLLPLLVGLGVLVAVLGLKGTVAPEQTQQQRRLAAIKTHRASRRVVRLQENDPSGVLRLFVPHSETERSQIARYLRQAGFHRTNAVRLYYLAKALVAIGLPAMLVLVYLAHPGFPEPMKSRLSGIARLQLTSIFTISTALLLVGYYAPSVWLRNKIASRRLQITRGFPNALDLLQVAIEAGLGFDAAMTRVAREMASTCPAIAEEFTIVQLEIQAGKDRDRSLTDMALRTGIEEMAAFSNVVIQSAEFGTPISAALEELAVELRTTRELKAQEKANKLPVKMSGVLASIMMPVLLFITLTPIYIRWVAMWAEAG